MNTLQDKVSVWHFLPTPLALVAYRLESVVHSRGIGERVTSRMLSAKRTKRNKDASSAWVGRTLLALAG